jgi:hypothetical protein
VWTVDTNTINIRSRITCKKNTHLLSMISGFRCKVYESCALLGYHIMIGGDFLTLEDGTDRLYHNIGNKLPPLAAK